MHMSHSRKHALVYTYSSGKFDQRVAHSRLRLRSRLRLHRCQDWDELVMPVIREVSDIWGTSKEDRHWIRPRWSCYFGEWYPDEKELAKVKRK